LKNKKLVTGLMFFILLAVIIPGALWLISGNTSAPTLHISVQDAHQSVNEGVFLLDVRTQEEWDVAHVPGAVLIPLDELENRVDEVPDDVQVIVMCRSGNRSQSGRDILISAGFENVSSMNGGINDWIKAGFEVE
jgi:rhodanese-related sulfurtransferase